MFSNSSNTIDLTVVFKIIKQFGIIISVPTSLIFLFIDFFIEKIKIKRVMYLTRCIIFLSLLYLVSLFFSFYIISSALFGNPLIK